MIDLKSEWPLGGDSREEGKKEGKGVYSQNSCYCWDWGRPKPEAYDCIFISHVGGEGQGTRASSTPFPAGSWVGSRVAWTWIGPLMWDVGIVCSSLSPCDTNAGSLLVLLVQLLVLYGPGQWNLALFFGLNFTTWCLINVFCQCGKPSGGESIPLWLFHISEAKSSSC